MSKSITFRQTIELLPSLEEMTQRRPQPVFQPKEFSVAWNAIPVLAYSGFPKTIIDIKSAIEEKLGNIELEREQYSLAEENMGSKWPKTTIGALRDDRDLSLGDVVALRNICDEFVMELHTAQPLVVERLHVVVFECRSLERRILSYPISFRNRYEKDRPMDTDIDDEIPAEHSAYVAWVLDGFSRMSLTNYWKNGLITGNGKECYYRGDHIEATLIVDLPHANSYFMERFIGEVDKHLPGMYLWFSPDSWHITVRALHYEKKARS